MISDLEIAAICGLIVACAVFLILNLFIIKKRQQLVQRFYSWLCSGVLIWLIAVLGLAFTDPLNMTALYIWDALTYVGVAFSTVVMLLIVLAFITGKEKMPRRWNLLLILPTVTNIMVWTNPLHHWHYRVFAVVRSELVFGPYLIISGAYTYLCLLVAVVLLLRFGVKHHSRLCWMQVAMLVLGIMVPIAVSTVATSGLADLSIAATPLSFTVTLLCTYVAIYRLHLLDIVPVATQHILDWTSDGYLVLNESGLVINENQRFRAVFGQLYGITTNKYLEDCVAEKDSEGKSALYILISAVQSCAESHAPLSYEQAVTLPEKNGESSKKYYYMVDVTPLDINDRMSGFVVTFKNITQIKKGMQQLQESQARMMEQERLAFLGQMVGGFAHNLKTPIMSIAGCTAATSRLVQEARESQGDEEVYPEDYLEIYEEIDDWLEKIGVSCSYMSDIITAIKEQTVNASTTEKQEFTLDELVKRTTLLLRHELLASGCKLILEYDPQKRVVLSGDINNLIQVINNLVVNAIDAEKDAETKEIYIGIEEDETHLSLYVKDTGSGISPRVRERLFREMITSKGTKGTGLGLYISNAIVRGKFGGFMWARDNPTGGAIFGFSIPLEMVSISRIDCEEVAGA
jgi:two-component system sensor histidine kinase HupT/HoxJ